LEVDVLRVGERGESLKRFPLVEGHLIPVWASMGKRGLPRERGLTFEKVKQVGDGLSLAVEQRALLLVRAGRGTAAAGGHSAHDGAGQSVQGA
jgi:hypothetical protein